VKSTQLSYRLLIGAHSPDAGPDLKSFRMDQARIAALLADFVGTMDGSKTPASLLLSNISMYVDMLLRWNRRINLTAIRDPEEIVTRHFGESLFTARHLFPHHEVAQAATVADVGSGAGFPGIPIKLWAPDISLTLIESHQKKATFLREVARALTLTNINIQDVRAESISHAAFDVVTLRAVERFDAVLPAAAALLKPQGRLALLIGTAQLGRAHSILPDHQFLAPIPIPLSEAKILLLSHAPEHSGEPEL
jgi:16S rRNA (guanine527-N7)-methyltransferase